MKQYLFYKRENNQHFVWVETLTGEDAIILRNGCRVRVPQDEVYFGFYVGEIQHRETVPIHVFDMGVITTEKGMQYTAGWADELQPQLVLLRGSIDKDVIETVTAL